MNYILAEQTALIEPLKVIAAQKEEIERLKKALEHYIDMTTLCFPEDWDWAGEGGAPDVNQLEKRDVGEVARVALGINDVVNEVLPAPVKLP